jgi:hypothetical protein
MNDLPLSKIIPSTLPFPVTTDFVKAFTDGGHEPVNLAYVTETGEWTTHCPNARTPAYTLSPEAQRLLASSTPLAGRSDVFVTKDGAYSLIAAVDAAGARYGIPVMVGPGSGPPTVTTSTTPSAS